MTMPEMQHLMLPLLRILGDGKEHSRSEVIDLLADQFQVSQTEREVRMANGQGKFDNLTYWVRAYFTQYQLIQNLENGNFQITRKGLVLLKKNPSQIDVNMLRNLPED